MRQRLAGANQRPASRGSWDTLTVMAPSGLRQVLRRMCVLACVCTSVCVLRHQPDKASTSCFRLHSF